MLNTLVANLPYLLKGAVVTLWLSLIVVTFGTLLGVIVGLCANVGGRLVQALVTTYVFVLRGIPVLVVMLLGYYAFPALGFHANAYVAVGIAQIIYIGAFVAEIVRSAVLSVPVGQTAAAKSLGMLRVRYPELTISQLKLGMPPLPPVQRDLVVGALSEVGLPA